MGLFDSFTPAGRERQEKQRAEIARQAEIISALHDNRVPAKADERLMASRKGKLPWVATLTPAELRIARSHHIRPIATVSSTCWMYYGISWTMGHAQGWETALRRLRQEAKLAGANAVLDVKMRTIPLDAGKTLDFTLVGTAVSIGELPPGKEPIVATVPALEFVKLIEAGVAPTGIAVGAHYRWEKKDVSGRGTSWGRNDENVQLSQLWQLVRGYAHEDLRRSAEGQGNGVLAHVNFSQIFEEEYQGAPHFLARHIVVATTVHASAGHPIPHAIDMVVDMRGDATPLTGRRPHHQSYASNEEEGPI